MNVGLLFHRQILILSLEVSGPWRFLRNFLVNYGIGESFYLHGMRPSDGGGVPADLCEGMRLVLEPGPD